MLQDHQSEISKEEVLFPDQIKKGASIVAIVPGPYPTHPPKGEENTYPQCEWRVESQSIAYVPPKPLIPNNAPIFEGAELYCLRVVEKDTFEDTPLLQVAFSPKELREKGTITFAHNPKNQQSVLLGTTVEDESLFKIALQWRGIEVVLWDVGGVINDGPSFWKKTEDLAKSYPANKERMKEFSDRERKKVDLGTMTEEAFWRGMLLYAGVSEAFLNANPQATDLDPYIQPVPGVVDILQRLTVEVRQGILSNDSHALAHLKKRKLYPGLVDENVFVISADLGIKKPDPEIYRVALKKAGMEEHPERVLFIDDKKEYCDAAIKVGMQCIVFENAEQLKAELKKLGLL